jgi:hypothetical protein
MIERKVNTANTLPVMLRDSSGAPVTGVVFGSVTCKYQKFGDTSLTTKTIDGTNWTEIGQGKYDIDFTAGELDTLNDFIYLVTEAISIQYNGLAEIVPETKSEIKTKTDTIDSNIDDLQLDVADVLVDTSNIITDIADIDTSTESEARFTEIKGVGWVTADNLHEIKTGVDNILNVGGTFVAGVVVVQDVNTIQPLLNFKIVRKTDTVYEVTAVNKETGVAIDLTGVTDIQYSIKNTIDDADYKIHKDLGPASKASLSVLTGNAQLDYEAVSNGVQGNDYSIEYIDPAINNSTLSVEVVITTITKDSQVVKNRNIKVSLATDGAGAITSTANDIETLLSADSTVSALVNITVPGTGADIVTAVSQTYLTGGLSGGIVYTDQANGKFKITIPQDETFAVAEGKYVYDIIATILSTRTQLIGGSVQFITGVTE